MAKYQKYAEYKDSGIKWLGEIPEHWIITLLKRYSFVKGGYAFSSDIFTSVGKPIIRIGDIQADGSISLENCKYIPVAVAENSQDYLVTKGQILMAMTGATIGKAGIFDSDEVAYLNQRVGKFIVDSKSLNYDYLWYLLKTHGYQEYIRLTAFGGAQPNISDTAMVDFCISIPSIDEQIKIAKFLDHETTKIDTLIAKQEKLIELLKEKRQAVISHAVTKGLNPNVPMKDSGVEWLGEVPEHWDVCKIQYYAKIESGHTPSKTNEKYWENCTIPWVSLNDSKQLRVVDYITDTKYQISELGLANSSARILPKETVVFTRDASIGLSAITTREMAVSQHLIAWLPNKEKLSPEFLLLIFYAMEKEFNRYTFGSTIKTIGMDDVRSLMASFPPLAEQLEIVSRSFSQFELIDTSIEKSNCLLNILKERRTALISAAVTGKIDVRDWKNPNKNKEADMELSA
ncbi:restriction endonuclease subunit S [Acinetobacter gyllenbergii]|nr:restriction endonuclease subunit S [Acinetobacter gyllenbergii]